MLALTGHTMLARWHLGPITGFHFWIVLVTSPEVLVFLFFMITDPKTAPRSPRHRIVYAVSLGLLASLMIAPATTEFASKVALLASLAVVCLAIPILRRWPVRANRRLLLVATPVVLAAFAGMIVFSSTKAAAGFRPLPPGTLPPITIQASQGVQTRLDLHTAQLIAHDLLSSVHATAADRLTLHLAPGRGQSPPVAVAQLAGQTYQLHQGVNGHWTLAVTAPTQVASGGPESTALAGLRLTDLAPALGLDFQQGAFRYGMSNDTKAMMGGGLCWLDYNNDGWQDLFVVNSYSSADAPQWEANGGLPRTSLFENVDGTFKDVSAATHADLPVQGDGCAAADLNGDGHTDLVVTTTSGVDAALEHGPRHVHQASSSRLERLVHRRRRRRRERRRPPGSLRRRLLGPEPAGAELPRRVPVERGRRSRPALPERGRQALQRGRRAGRPRSFPISPTGSARRSPMSTATAVRTSTSRTTRIRTSSMSMSRGRAAHGRSGRPRLSLRGARGCGRRRRPVRRDGRGDERHVGRRLGLFVTNSRNEPSAAYVQTASGAFANVRPRFDPALGTGFAGWGTTWVDFANSGTPDLLLTAGAIPVTNLSADAEAVRVLAPVGGATTFGDAKGVIAAKGVRLNGRGAAAADVANDGRMDVAINTIGGKLVLLHPSGPAGHWLDVQLSRFAPGAVVTVVLPDGRRLTQMVQAGSSYLSSEDQRVHFGLGAATSVRSVAVRYPWGGRSFERNVAANRVVHDRIAARPSRSPPRRLRDPSSRTARPSRSTAARSRGSGTTRPSTCSGSGGASEPVQARDLFDLSTAVSQAWHATGGSRAARPRSATPPTGCSSGARRTERISTGPSRSSASGSAGSASHPTSRARPAARPQSSATASAPRRSPRGGTTARTRLSTTPTRATRR